MDATDGANIMLSDADTDAEPTGEQSLAAETEMEELGPMGKVEPGPNLPPAANDPRPASSARGRRWWWLHKGANGPWCRLLQPVKKLVRGRLGLVLKTLAIALYTVYFVVAMCIAADPSLHPDNPDYTFWGHEPNKRLIRVLSSALCLQLIAHIRIHSVLYTVQYTTEYNRKPI